MKKVIKIILMLVSIMMIIGLSVYGTYNYLAKDVKYVKDDDTQISVEDALNELYSKIEYNDIPAEYTIAQEQIMGVHNFTGPDIPVLNLDLSLFKIIGYRNLTYRIGVAGASNYKLTLKTNGNNIKDSVTSSTDDVWVYKSGMIEIENIDSINLTFDLIKQGFGYYIYELKFSK